MNATGIGSMPSIATAFELTGNISLSKSQLENLKEVAKHLNLTEEEEIDFIKAIESNRIVGEVHPTGKLSWAVVVIRKGYNALPSPVKTAIDRYIKIEALLSIIDTYTGEVEEGIKFGLTTLHCPETAAWWITKTLMAFVL